MTNNQGIYHLNIGGRVACRRPNAHIFLVFADFQAHTGKRCKRCEKHAAKMAALADKKAAASAHAESVPTCSARTVEGGMVTLFYDDGLWSVNIYAGAPKRCNWKSGRSFETVAAATDYFRTCVK